VRATGRGKKHGKTDGRIIMNFCSEGIKEFYRPELLIDSALIFYEMLVRIVNKDKSRIFLERANFFY
jgi:hypothetical protein